MYRVAPPAAPAPGPVRFIKIIQTSKQKCRPGVTNTRTAKKGGAHVYIYTEYGVIEPDGIEYATLDEAIEAQQDA